MEQKPSICRMVVYNLTEQEQRLYHMNSAIKQYPAVIVRISEEDPAIPLRLRGKKNIINITVFTDDGPINIHYVEQGDGYGQWNWPPRV